MTTSRGASSTRLLAVVVALFVLGGGVAAAQRIPPDSSGDDRAAVRWAVDNGITRGVDESGDVRPEDPVTRAQMVVFLRRLDALVAERQLALGPITMSHPPSAAVARTGDASRVTYEGAHVTLSGRGRVLVPLAGPGDLGGRDFVFSSVEYCVSDARDTEITDVVVLQSPEEGGLTPTAGDPHSDGCATYSGAGSGWVSGQAATLQIEVSGPGSMRLTSVTSSWVPS